MHGHLNVKFVAQSARGLSDEVSVARQTECLMQHWHHSIHYSAPASLNNVTRNHDFGWQGGVVLKETTWIYIFQPTLLLKFFPVFPHKFWKIMRFQTPYSSHTVAIHLSHFWQRRHCGFSFVCMVKEMYGFYSKCNTSYWTFQFSRTSHTSVNFSVFLPP